MTANNNRIDPTPARLSTNITVDRQTPKTDFGDRVKVGLDQASSTIASGAAIVGGFIPGGAIVSAAVSSVSNLTNSQTPSGGAITAHYAQAGSVIPVGSGGAGNGGINTTVGGTMPNSFGTYGGNGQTVPGYPNYATGGAVNNSLGDVNSTLVQSQKENAQMMQLQMAMQRENIVFTSVSNVLKTRHETSKNSISNVR